ncbi:hypothetical protein [Candidatus Tisiphia endosymbiont of Sialis lutaria]
MTTSPTSPELTICDSAISASILAYEYKGKRQNKYRANINLMDIVL